jgi:uncharacterized membrane-anchored protein YitT (DUF2179 family)
MSRQEIAESITLRSKREKMSATRTFVLLNCGLLLTAIAAVFFKTPNHFALGGTTGVSILLSALFPTHDMSYFMWVINAGLVVLGLVFLDRRTIGLTVYASFALSAMISVLSWLFPISQPMTDEPLLELCFAVALPALGSAIIFNVGASSGGTDILAMILKKKTNLPIGRALLVADGVVVAATLPLFGAETALLCILGLLGKTLIVDNAIEGFNLSKVCTIICDDPDETLSYITQEMHRTATLREVTGGFSGQPMTEIVCVLTRPEAVHLRKHVRDRDPNAFITMVNSSEIVGRGFRDPSN